MAWVFWVLLIWIGPAVCETTPNQKIEEKNVYRAVLESVGLTLPNGFQGGTEGGSGHQPESMRERVCRLQGALSDLRVVTQLVYKWIESDFAARSESERTDLARRTSQFQIDRHGSSLVNSYSSAIAASAWFTKLSCRHLAAWVSDRRGAKQSGDSDPTTAARCSHAERKSLLDSWIGSEEFVDSRLKLVFQGPVEPPFGMERALATARGLRDPIAALAILLADRAPLNSKVSRQEFFGFPVGPYACSGGQLRVQTKPLISTSFYYWFDFKEEPPVTRVHQPDNWDNLFSVVPPKLSGMSFEKSEWFSSEWHAMARAGINTAFLVYRGGPYGHFAYADSGVVSLVRGLDTKISAQPAIALLIDGYLFSSRGNKSGRRLGFSSHHASQLMAATARDFYSMIPAGLRAHWDGRLIVGFKNLSQASRIDAVALKDFRLEFGKIFGAPPYLLFPRQELVDYVVRSNPGSLQSAVERLSQGVAATEVLASMIKSAPIIDRIGKTNLEIVHHFWRLIFFPSSTRMSSKYWPEKATGDKNVLISALVESSASSTAERYRERLTGIPGDYLRSYSREDLIADLFVRVAETVAIESASAKKTEKSDEGVTDLSLAFLGRCPSKEERVKLSSMLDTWSRPKAASYLLSTRDGLRQFVAGWLVDTVMAPAGVVDLDVHWDGYECGVPYGVATVFPGRNDRGLAKLSGSRAAVIDRSLGSLYSELFKTVADRAYVPKVIHIESWNGFHDGTAVAPSVEFGSRYADLTREHLVQTLKKLSMKVPLEARRSVAAEKPAAGRAPASTGKMKRGKGVKN